LMYAKENVDFTSDIITVLNKPGRSTTSAASEKPAPAAAANTPAKAASPRP
jgi:hypothetical protein